MSKIITLNEKVIRLTQQYKRENKVKTKAQKKYNKLYFLGLIRPTSFIDEKVYEIVEIISINEITFKDYIRSHYDKDMVRYYDFRTMEDKINNIKEEIISITHIILFSEDEIDKETGKIDLEKKIRLELTEEDFAFNRKRLKHHFRSGVLDEEEYMKKAKSGWF